MNRQRAFETRFRAMKSELIALIIAIVLSVLAFFALTARADDRNEHRREREHDRNYIIDRQLDYQVDSGSQPSDRIIIGRRQIDVYSDGTMFDGDHIVGHRK